MKPDLRIVRTMPVQKPGKSKQDYETPKEFIAACERRFGPIEMDLAATDDNHKAPAWITPEIDSLSIDWDKLDVKLAFLNPTFGNIPLWARKCAEAKRLPILFLIPASVGSNWWAHHVHQAADLVLFLQGRIEFDGLPCTRRKGKEQTCKHDASAHFLSLSGRCSECDCVGFCKDGYPKDCALVVYNRTPVKNIAHPLPRYECWDWRKGS